ncbi:condensation domain-containing protein, partial [Streptomyces sp. NPDC006544]|uniref:condensation domain-containing protein n=1 Tax=Streptomyces sp. NPDC006544 TaxID=3154583 RepID=UPI0033B0346F
MGLPFSGAFLGLQWDRSHAPFRAGQSTVRSPLTKPQSLLTEQVVVTMSEQHKWLVTVDTDGHSQAPQSTAPSTVQPAQRSGPAPLSPAQLRLWFLHQLDPNSAEYTSPLSFRVRGSLAVRHLETALSGLVRRHEVLRTRFVTTELGEPAQIVDDPWQVEVTLVDLTEGGRLAAREQAGYDIVRTEIDRPFDLASGRPLRALAVRLDHDPDDHLVLICLHHIVED